MTFFDKFDSFLKRNFTLLVVIALFLAAFMRLINLGASSLTNHEATIALQALNTSKSNEALIGGQPGYIGLTSLLFMVFDSTDFFARFWPALFGIALALAPVLLRKQLGELATVLLIFLIAFEPGLVALSRSADGTMITISSLLLSIGLIVNRKMIPAGILAGLAVAGSENFWPLIFAIGLAWLLVFLSTEKKSNALRISSLNIERTKWWGFALAGVITILLISSQYLLRPNGISGLGSSFSDYFTKWIHKGDFGLGVFMVIFLVSQFPALIFGIWGLVNGLKEKSLSARFLGLWWVIGLLLAALNPSRETLQIAMVNLPIFILAAMQIARLLEGLLVRSTFVFVAEAVVTISLLIFSILNFLNMINFPPGDAASLRNRLLGTFLPLALWIAFTVLLAWGWDAVSSKSGIVLGLGLLLGALLISSGWKATDMGSYPQNELLANPGYVFGHKDLFQTVEDISLWNTGQKNRIDLELVGVTSPSLTWAFRDFAKTTLGDAFPVTDSPSIVISGVDAVIQTQSLYRGQMIVWSLEPDYSQVHWQDWVKWFFNRQLPQKKTEILLWVRNDLFKDTATQN